MPIIQSLDRALQILDLFDEQTPELRITDISKRLDLHKSTLHSLLKTLQLHGYIHQDTETGKYQLGMKLLERGHLLLQTLDIRTVARRNLTELSQLTGQTTHLVVLDGKEGVYIDNVEGSKAAIRYSRIGRRVPLHSSAVGKVLAANLSPEDLTRVLTGYVFQVQTPATIRDKAAFLLELEQVRSLGYALDNEENEQGVRCSSVAIRDHTGKVVAAMSISTMTSSVTSDQLGEFTELMLEHAKTISRLMGYRGE